MRVLSVVVPAYNEEAFIGAMIEAILEVDTESSGFTKEIIVVNDGSKDGTEAVVRRYPQVKLINQQPNQGRGAALRRGDRGRHRRLHPLSGCRPRIQSRRLSGPAGGVEIRRSRGVRQPPRRRDPRVRPRDLPGKHPRQGIAPWGAALVIRAWTSVLVGHWVPDMYTGLKLYPAAPLQKLTLETSGFELDHEITVSSIAPA